MQANWKQVAIRLGGIASVALLLALPSPGAAREPLYGVLDHAELLRCEALRWSGQAAAANCYRELTALVHPPQIRAEAYWALDDLQTANALFQSAAGNSPENALIKIRWGELFMQTYQYQEGYNLFAEALELDGENAWAHVGAALALSQGDNSSEVSRHLSAVLDNFFTAPGARLRGLLMTIRAAMERDRHQEARELLEEAKQLAQEASLPMMELRALEAALAFLTRQEYQPFIDLALEESPGYGDAYGIPGYFATITRRYRESAEFYQQAVAVQPNLWRAHLELGQNLLRLNRVTAAVEHVEISYQGDAFNPKTINMLRLLDTFIEDFVLVSYPDPPLGDLPDLVLRLDRDERDVLKNYARKLAEDSISAFSERYRFAPKEPVIVEIYPNHEDFIVRSIGMPGVGLLGVTFGYLFAMDSPSAHPEESYHWGTTLWHEMAHVFTLGATANGVPRWFSEGVSVFEEWRTGPIPGRKIPTEVLQAMAEGKFLPIAQLDDGFMRPTYDGQVGVSYIQAGLVIEFMDLEYGFDHIVDILYQFNHGADPVAAIEGSLGISAADFDSHFRQFIDIEYGPLLGNLHTWRQDHAASLEALQNEDWEGAAAAAERAVFTYPDYVETDSPYVVMARAHAQLEQPERELQALETFWQKGGYAPSALLTLADRYLEREQRELASKVLMAVNYADPFNQELHVKLGDLHMEMGQPALALEEYLVLLALKPLDRAAANYRVATAYQALDDQAKSMEHLMTALDLAPQYRPAQMLLLDMSRGSD